LHGGRHSIQIDSFQNQRDGIDASISGAVEENRQSRKGTGN